MLFTGDAEEPTEHELVSYDIGDIDLLKVAHHGSSHSSSRSFLAHTKPEIAIISAGEGNRYGHPDAEALERLEQVNALVYRTDLSSHIRVISDGASLEVLEGSLEELLGISIAAIAPPQTKPERPAAMTSEPAPVDDLTWIKGASRDVQPETLSQVMASIKERRTAEKQL